MLERLQARYAELAARARELQERLNAGTGSLSAEDSEQITLITTEMGEVRSQIDELRRLDETIQANEAANEMWGEVAGSGVPVQSEASHNPFPLSTLARQAANGDNPEGVVVRPELVARERQFLRAGMTATDIVDAYRRGMAYGVDDQTQQIRLLQTGTDTAGGYLIPTITDRTLYDEREYVGGVRAAGATVVTTETGAEMEFPKVTTHFAVVSTAATPGTHETAEGATSGLTEDVFGQTRVATFEYTAKAEVTRQLLQDNIVDLEMYLAKMLGRVMAKKTEARYHYGDGVGEPKGILNGPPVGQTGTTIGSNQVGFPDLKLMYKLDASYMAMFESLKWLMASAVYGEFVFLVDTDGRPLFPQPPGGQPRARMLVEAGVVFSSFMADGLADDDICAMVGNFEDAYIIRDVAGTTIEASGHQKFDERKVIFQAAGRHGGNIQDPKAVRFLKVKPA